MILGILSRTQTTETTTLLYDRARARGWDVLSLSPASMPLGFGGIEFPNISCDALLARVGSNSPLDHLDLLWSISATGIPCYNEPAAITQSRDKVIASHHLGVAGVAMPRTVKLAPEGSLEATLSELPGPPWVLKLAHGSKGVGVMRVDSEIALKSLLDFLFEREERVVLQEHLDLKIGADVRVLVLAGEPVAAVRRTPSCTDFRSNRAQGGGAAFYPMTPAVKELACRAAGALGLIIAGVDIAVTPDRNLVLEVNASPGLMAFTATDQHFVVESVLNLFGAI